MKHLIMIAVTSVALSGLLNVDAAQDRPDTRTVDNSELPRVLVVGDSISMNYHNAAKAALKGKVNYYRIQGNGGPSDRGVSSMELWLGDYTRKGLQWDVIQFNHGLHDLKQPYDKNTDTWGAHQVAIEDYKKNLAKEIEIMKQTGATLIWCATTPVPNSNPGQYARRKGEAMVFNKAAMEVISKYPEIQINDLHKVVCESDVFDNWRKGSNVHFKGEEQAVLGKAVADAVTKTLTITTACSLYAKDYHVSTTGLDDNTGTKSRPFKTISAAAQIAQPGDVITVHEGVYRERVNPPRGGESDTKRIVYQAAPGEKVVIKGSEVVKGWERVQDGVWKVTLPNSFFGDYNPYTDVIKGEWHYNKGYPRHTGTVYVNGNWMDEAKQIENVLAPIGGRPLWKAKVNEKNTTIWAQFKDIDPNKEVVEINVRQCIFYPDQPGRNYITVRGFVMRQAATPWSGAMSEQIGLIGTHWSKGWVIEDNVISHSMNTGITLGRYDLSKFGIALPAVSAPGFVKSCELALKHGWSKQKIGSHVVRNNHISHCEKNGIHGSLGGIFSTIEGNTICDIAMRGWIGGPDVAGLKLLASHDVIIRGNHIYRCGAVGGLWLDWMAQGTRVTGNLLHDNSQDLFVEVNHGPFLVDNNIFLSRGNIRDWSQGSAYAHNLFAGSISGRKERRQTPYFKSHTVKDMKLSNIQHKDARYHNNMFVGRSGLSAYGGEPVNTHAAGNVYLAGAKPGTHDRDALVAADFKPNLKLEEKSDGWWLEMAVDPTWTTIQKRAVVTTELLPKAKIPDAPFEQPDGTPYTIDTDYFGKKRSTDNPAPGPFNFSSKKVIRHKVWPGK